MKNEVSLPSLGELATPYQHSDALPADISVSVALIADTPPGQLQAAAKEAIMDYNRTYSKLAGGYNPIVAGRFYHEMREIVENGNQQIGNMCKEHADSLAAELGANARLGYEPSGDALQSVLDSRAEAAEFVAKDPEDDPEVVTAREEFEATAADDLINRMRLDDLTPSKELGEEVQKDVRHLSRRGRQGSVAAGLILGGLAALGILHEATQNRNEAMAALQASPHLSSAEQYKLQSRASINEAAGPLFAGMALVASTVAGVGAGALGKGWFARRRAASIVRKARETENATR